MKRKEELRELRTKKTSELILSLKEAKEELRKAYLSAKMGELKDLKLKKKLRKKIAQILTLLREKLPSRGEGEK